MQTRNSRSVVVRFLIEQIEKSGRPVEDVARQAGMSSRMLQMILDGQTKLAINQADPIANALGVEPVFVLRLVLEDSLPQVWAILQDKLAELSITPFEEEVVTAYRRLAQGRDIRILMLPAGQGYVEVVPPKAATRA